MSSEKNVRAKGSNIKRPSKQFITAQNEIISIALDLRYSQKIIDMLKNAKTEMQLYNIMREARGK